MFGLLNEREKPTEIQCATGTRPHEGGGGRYIVLAKSTNCPNAKGPETTKDRTAFRENDLKITYWEIVIVTGFERPVPDRTGSNQENTNRDSKD